MDERWGASPPPTTATSPGAGADVLGFIALTGRRDTGFPVSEN